MKWASSLFAVAPGITSGTAKEVVIANTIHWGTTLGRKDGEVMSAKNIFKLPPRDVWVGDATNSRASSYLWFGDYRIYLADLSVEHFVGTKTEKLGRIAETLEETKQFIENQSLLEG